MDITRRLSTSPATPLSPALERMEEKRELNELNSRLGNYIQHVQDLSSTNEDLKRRLEARSHPSPPSTLKLYEDQIRQLRQDLEESKKEKALLVRDLKQREEEAARAKGELEEVGVKLKHVENLKVHYEQKVPQLENQLSFVNRLLDDEQAQNQLRLREMEEEVEKIKAEAKGELVAKLAEYGQSIRQDAENARRDLQEAHSEAIKRLEEEKAATDVENANLRVENSSLAGERDVLQGRIEELQRLTKALQAQLERLISDRDIERLRAEKSSKGQAEEIAKLRSELGEMKVDFNELTHAKVALDAEIRSYKRLLAVGETALSSSASSSSVSRKRSVEESAPLFVPRKHSRVVEAMEAGPAVAPPAPPQPSLKFVNSKRGIVNIEELNPDGQYIRISNLTSSEIDLSNWWIQIGKVHDLGSQEIQPKRFKFPEGSLLSAEDSLQVLVKITDDVSENEGRSISFSSKLIRPGASIQLFNDVDDLISQVDLLQGDGTDKEGSFDRVCLLM